MSSAAIIWHKIILKNVILNRYWWQSVAECCLITKITCGAFCFDFIVGYYWLSHLLYVTNPNMLGCFCILKSWDWHQQPVLNLQNQVIQLVSNTAVSDVYMSYCEWVARFVRQGMVVCVFWELCILHFIFAFQVQPELIHNKSLVFSSCNSGGFLYFFLRQVTHNSKDYMWKMAFSSAATMVG